MRSTGRSEGEGRRVLPLVALVVCTVVLAVAVVSLVAGSGDRGPLVVGATPAEVATTVATTAPAPAPAPPTSPTTVAELAPGVPVPSVVVRSAALDALEVAEVVAPVRLRLPSIGVDARVVAVGVARDGQLDVPDADDVGWYRYGPAPGHGAGSVVLAGHVDMSGRRGVFWSLRSLRPGDEVLVTLENGTEARYLVTGLRQIPKRDLPVDEVFSPHGPEVLTLITCGGSFDAGSGHYRDNIVAWAVPA